VARRRGAGSWTPADATADAGVGAAADEVLLGGRLHDVLRASVANRGPLKPDQSAGPGPARTRSRHSNLIPATAIALGAVFVLSTIVLASSLHLHGVNAVYTAFTTGWGNPDLAGRSGWLQLFGIATMVAVGALVGVLFSHLAAFATAERLDVRAGRRAARSADHVVIAGLGTVGYRVERLLHGLGIPTVVLERDESSRFSSAVGAHAPVLAGDASLPENLERAGIRRAACLVAATHDDLVNLSACLHARRLNPGIRTVARIFDDTIVEHAGGGLGVDAVVSASRAAAAAFLGAATDERAVRRFSVDGLDLAAVRVPDGTVSRAADGVCVLASDHDLGSAVVAGPAAAVDAMLR
jgi:Trk K+ transport system NAD-binding subunit